MANQINLCNILGALDSQSKIIRPTYMHVNHHDTNGEGEREREKERERERDGHTWDLHSFCR